MEVGRGAWPAVTLDAIALANHLERLGIAADTPNGLIVPVIREVQSKGILQLAAELNELAERTRTGKVRPEELKGSTFSITNAGNIGGISMDGWQEKVENQDYL